MVLLGASAGPVEAPPLAWVHPQVSRRTARAVRRAAPVGSSEARLRRLVGTYVKRFVGTEARRRHRWAWPLRSASAQPFSVSSESPFRVPSSERPVSSWRSLRGSHVSGHLHWLFSGSNRKDIRNRPSRHRRAASPSRGMSPKSRFGTGMRKSPGGNGSVASGSIRAESSFPPEFPGESCFDSVNPRV